MKKRIFLWCIAAVCIFCSVSYAAGEVIGYNTRAMSPRPTSVSYGARVEEVTLGNYVADAVRDGTGAQFALVCGGHLENSLLPGELTEEDVSGIFGRESSVMTVQVTPEQLWHLLSFCISTLQLNEEECLDAESGSDFFPQVSGLEICFDVSQAPEKRLRTIALEDGTELKPDDDKSLLRAAISEELVAYADDLPEEPKTAGTEEQLLIGYIRRQGTVSVPEVGRIRMIGSADQTIFSNWKLGHILPYLLLVVLLLQLPKLKKRDPGT